MELELASLERPVERVAGVEMLERPSPGTLVEELGAMSALVLGAVHRGVGVADEGLRRLGSVSGAGDPDAGGDEDLVVGEQDGTRDLFEDSVGEAHHRVRVVDVGAEDRELVTAETGHGVARSQHATEAVADGHEELVAGFVSQAVVDDLEVVEVEEEHRDATGAARRAIHRLADPVHEERAVREAGEGVVDGLVGEALTDRLAFGDVLDLADHVDGLAARISDGGDAQRDPHDVAVGVEVALLESVAADLAGEEAPDVVGVLGPVVRVGDVPDREPDEIGRLASEHAGERPVVAQDPTVRVGERHADRGVLERAAEPLLALSQRGFGLEAFRDVSGVDDDAADVGVADQVGGDDF